MPDDTMAPWSEVAEQMRQAFPTLNPEEMERRYNHALSLGAARQQVQDREAPGVFETIQRNAAPFLSPVSNTGMAIAYGRARQRYEAGRPEPTDFETIARHEQEREARERQGFGGQVLENLSGLPAVAGEMALTGGATSGLRAPVRAALLPLTTPSFGLAQGTIENNIQQGRDPLSVRGLPGAYLRSLVQAAVFEGMGGAGNVLGAGARGGMQGAAQRFVQRTLGGTAAMEAGNDLADAVGQFGPAWLTGEDKPGEHRYGAIGAALRGEHGQALQQLALHGMTNAAFALMHAPHDNPAEQARVIEESRRATQQQIDAEHVRRNQTAVPSLQEGPEGHAGWTTYPTVPDVERMTPEQRRAVAEHYGYGPVLDTFDRLNRDIAAGGVSILTTPPGRPAEAPSRPQTAPEAPEAPEVHPVQAASEAFLNAQQAHDEAVERYREENRSRRGRSEGEWRAAIEQRVKEVEPLREAMEKAQMDLVEAMRANRPAPQRGPAPSEGQPSGLPPNLRPREPQSWAEAYQTARRGGKSHYRSQEAADEAFPEGQVWQHQGTAIAPVDLIMDNGSVRTWHEATVAGQRYTFHDQGPDPKVPNDRTHYVEMRDREGNAIFGAVVHPDARGGVHVDQNLPLLRELETRTRGRGRASALYDYIAERFGTIRPSDAQTQSGADFWRKNAENAGTRPKPLRTPAQRPEAGGRLDVATERAVSRFEPTEQNLATYAQRLHEAIVESLDEPARSTQAKRDRASETMERATEAMRQAGHAPPGTVVEGRRADDKVQRAAAQHFNGLIRDMPEAAQKFADMLLANPERARDILNGLPGAQKEAVDGAAKTLSGGKEPSASLRRGLESLLRAVARQPKPQPAPERAGGSQGAAAGEGPAEAPGAGPERGGRPAPAHALPPAAGNVVNRAGLFTPAFRARVREIMENQPPGSMMTLKEATAQAKAEFAVHEEHRNDVDQTAKAHGPEAASALEQGFRAGVEAGGAPAPTAEGGGQAPEALGMGAAGAGGLPPGSAPPGVKPIGSPLVPEPEPGRGRTGYLNWWQKALDAVKSFAGQTFPRLTRFSRPAGEALAAAANSDRSWKDRWNYISRVVRFGGSSIADMSPEQRRWLGGAVVETRARLEREALEREGKPTDHVGTLIGQADSPFQTEADFQQARDDLRELREALRQEWTPVVEKDFRDIKGLDEFEEIHQRNQIPGMPMSLIPLDETAPGAVRMGGKQGLQNLRVRNPSFTRRATLTGDAYDIDLAHMMQRRLQTGTQAAARAKAVRELLKSGTLEQLEPGQQPTEGFRELMLRPSGGLPGLDPNARYYAMSDVAGEIQRGLGIGERFGAAQGGLKALQSVMNIPTSIGLLSPAEITTHVANNIGALRTPELGRSFWQNVGGAIRDGWRAFRNDPETLRRIKDLSEIGASFGHEARGGLLSTVGLGRWSAYDPTTYVNRFTSSFIDFMQKGVRLQLDSMLDRMARARGIEFSDTERRDFINQSLGNYNNRASNTLTQFLKDSGIQPFATAAHTFTSRAVRTLFGGGVMPTAQTWTDAAQMRAISYAKMLPVLAIGPAVNAMLWGDAFPKGVPTLAIKVSDEDHMDPLAFLGLRRGARITGVNAVVEGLMRGDRSASQIFDRAVRDFRMSMGHLLEGPPVQTLHTALTGENFAGHRLTDRKPASQTLANLGAAAGNVNPLVGTLTGADRPKNPPSLPQRLLRSVGPFGLRPTPKQ